MINKTISTINKGFAKKYLKESLDDNLKKTLTKALKAKGYNTSADGYDAFIDAAVEYLNDCEYYGSPMTVDEWIRETEANYPEELSFMKPSVEKEIFHNDNGEDYEVVERSASGSNALLHKGKQWIIAWNCPKNNQGSWGQGHYFFDEESARKAWEDKYVNESFILEAIQGILCKLEEASISPEDKADSDALRAIYNKIGGKQITSKTLTPEEKALLQKYGIDAWGYKGDSKVVTNSGRKDIVQNADFDKDYSGRVKPTSKFNKINYADRARKIDDRDYAQSINAQKGWRDTRSFNELERTKNDVPSEKIRTMKNALKTRNYASSALSSIDSEAETKKADIERAYNLDMHNADKEFNSSKSFSDRRAAEAEAQIQAILDRHRVKECYEALLEKEMSPEDKADSELLKSIYQKTKKRSNAKLTSEEQAVLDKYGLSRNMYGKNGSIMSDNDFNSTYNYKTRSYEPPKADKINYADRARKVPDRDYSRQVRSRSWKDNFQDSEREFINNNMSKDVRDMQSALYDRSSARRSLQNASIRYQSDKDSADARRQKRLDDLETWKKNRSSDLENQRDTAQATINNLLKKESLNEAEEKRIVDTGLTGNKGHDLLAGVIGQMSDGMWENSPGMIGYWYPIRVQGTQLLIDPYSNFKYFGRYIDNKYYNMSDDEVRKFFANKIKAIAQQFLHDNNLNPYTYWNENCDEVCDYLDYHSGVTVGDAYKAYKLLK